MVRKYTFIMLVMVCVAMLSISCSRSEDAPANQSNAVSVDTVTISNMAFHPPELSVNKGDTVMWINEDIVPHDVAAFPDNKWASDTLSMGQTWKKVIGEDLDYFCNIHPTMKGKVVLKK